MSYTLEVSVGSKVASSAPPRELPKQTNTSGSALPPVALDASDYHALASAAELLATLRDENKTNKLKSDKQQYTHMEFVDKKTGEVLSQRVIF